MNFIKELWRFLRKRKKLWLFPVIIVMVFLGALLIFAQGSVFAPFIYTLLYFFSSFLYILGISAYYHDAAACLLQHGEVIAAAQEERFSRKNVTLLFLEKHKNYSFEKIL